MTDSTVIWAVGTIVGALQVAQTAYLHYLATKNSCGGAKCIETMTRALNIRVERTPGTVAVNGVTHTDPRP